MRRQDSPQSVYARFDELLKTGNLDQALVEAGRGLARYQNPSEPWHWKFYLARTEVALKKDGPRAALVLLQEEPPAGPEFAESRSRRKYDQARAYFALSDYSKSRDLLVEATQIAESSDSKSLLSLIELVRSNVLSRLGDWDGAEVSLREANRLSDEQHDAYTKSFAVITLAFVLIHQSRFEEAIYPLQGLIPLLDEQRDGPQLAKALSNLGWCYFRLGEYDRALQAFKRAEVIDGRIGDIGERQTCIGNIASVYFEDRDLPAATRYYMQALEISRARGDRFSSAKWLSNLAVVAIESQDWAKAENYNREALEIQRQIPDRIGELHSLKNAARIAQGNGRNDEAEGTFQRVIDSNSQDPAPVLDAEAGLAQLYASTARPEKAEQQFRAALALVDRGRSRLVKDDYKLAYLASLIEFYQSHVDWLMSTGKAEQALEVAEASRARILGERTGVNRTPQASSAARYRQLARASGSVFLSFWTAPKRSYAWVIAPNQIVSYAVPPESRIQKLIENYRGLIESLQNPLESDDPSGRELYSALLAPARQFIPEGSRVSVVPDGSLYALNFETLPVPDPKPHYWIEDATIDVVPALNLLTGSPTAESAGKALLLIGNPEQADERFPRLPYAAQEIALVRNHFEPSQVNAVEGKNAVPAAYASSQLGRFSYVHFTAHATANRQSPLDSAIILSGPGANYKLTARDVMKHPINAELVTISACRSAGARTYAGEGLVGFTWTFFQAGAHNVIAGLWDVNDESTPKIMDHLYAGVSQGQPIAVALRSAKLAILNDHRTFRLPYYWGALQLFCRDRLQNSRNIPAVKVASN